ncbi:HelD family protein [Glutamicibacter sp. HZAU]|uniref:HelD family protein n=1 Tax=Glutamicibacter sp. HZAU TaxID=2049891 RepID=UPI000FFC1499|nr:UvrD-helicase domain-containing protein [Glutamicibacter sp. HZAU]RWZ85298.1 hypothetical protein EKH49_01990 [Glutamicibacter sp. HZAU]
MTSSSMELRAEQAYFDEAMESHEASFNLSSSDGSGVGTAAERRALKKHLDSKIRLSKDDAVAFRRYQMEDEETYYVGKTPILDEDGDYMVISWKSPKGGELYQSSSQEPNGVVARRDYTTTGNHIDQLSDRFYKELAEKVSSLVDEVKSDPVLLAGLESSRTGKMQDIVQTIQASQDKLIRSDKDQLLIIQGGPGTGKTAVALHRASWLLFNYRDDLSPEDMMVVGPTPSFTRYIQNVLPELGDDHVYQTSIIELLEGKTIKVNGTDQESVARVKGSDVMADVIAQGLNNRIKLPISPLRINRKNSASSYVIAPEQLRSSLDELRSRPYSEGRKALRARLLEECAKASVTRSSAINIENQVSLQSLESALDRIWPRLSPEQFVRDLLGSKARLQQAAQNLISEEQAGLLYRAPAERMAEEPWTIADLALIDEARSHMNADVKLWGHILLDEAQDLTPMQLHAIRRRSLHGSMTVVGDLAQSTGAFPRDSWDPIQQALRTSLPSRIEHLDYGYRVPKEVYVIAERLLPLAAPGIKPPKIIREVATKPRLLEVVPGRFHTEVAAKAGEHSSNGRFVGVIAPAEHFDALREAFDQQDVQWDDSTVGGLGRSINLVTPEMSKGLEFDAVIIVDPQRILETDDQWGARLLYIALTRTTRYLDVIGTAGEVPQILRGEHFDSSLIDGEPDVIPSEQSDENDSQTVTLDTDDDIKSNHKVASNEIPATEDLDTTNLKNIEISKFNAIESELLKKNSQYLCDILLGTYTEKMARAILLEAAQMLPEAN